ncbi:MAG: PspC domain-containing protein [Coriobacteriales bacterium]|jgi:phage shock protein PspC (stress-responsive transcriptional regulator)|nr:PspC domain-containing protein [Coriobacteriales bacterium]
MSTNKRLYRGDDAVVGGVCGGIAEYFSIDATFVRIIAIALMVASLGTFIIFYIAAFVIMPKCPYDDTIGTNYVKPSACNSAPVTSATPKNATAAATSAKNATAAATNNDSSASSTVACSTPVSSTVACSTPASSTVACSTSVSSTTTGVPSHINATTEGASSSATATAAGTQNPTEATTAGTQNPTEATTAGTQNPTEATTAGAQNPTEATTTGAPDSTDTTSAGKSNVTNNVEKSKNRWGTTACGGALLVGVGIIILLSNLVNISFWRFWPLVLIIFGVVQLFTPSKTGWSLERAGGSIVLISFGVLFLALMFGIVTIRSIFMAFSILWPVFLVVAGLAIIAGARKQEAFSLIGSLVLSATMLIGVWYFGGVREYTSIPLDNNDVLIIELPQSPHVRTGYELPESAIAFVDDFSRKFEPLVWESYE